MPVIIQQAKPKVQERIYVRKGPVLALSRKEKTSQKKPCLILSTGVSAEMVDHRRASGKVKQLPKIISLYNQLIGGVDLFDPSMLGREGSTNIGRNASLELLIEWLCVHTYCTMKTPAIPQS